MMQAAVPRISPGNAQNRGDRDYQEDAFGFTDRSDPAFVRHAGVAAVLCDGMGGLQFGAESAVLAVDTFLDEYRRKLLNEQPGVALKRAALRANEAVFRFARENNVVQRTGCTLVAVVARGVELHCVHAGDSRAYLYSGGRLERLTTDHTYARRLERQVEQGQLTPREAAEHPQRDHLTSNLGRQDLTELDLLDPPKKLAPNDWILLCSDGLHGMLSDAEIAAELHGSSQDAAQRLVQRVTERPEPEKDNVTVVILQVGTDGALLPSHQTWQSGRHSHAAQEPRNRSKSSAELVSSSNAQSTKRAPAWIWPLTTVPLVLALATWLLWPTKKLSDGPATAGFETTQAAGKPQAQGVNATAPAPKVPQAVVQDLPNPPIPVDQPPRVKLGIDSNGKPNPNPNPTGSSKPGNKPGTGSPTPSVKPVVKPGDSPNDRRGEPTSGGPNSTGAANGTLATEPSAAVVNTPSVGTQGVQSNPSTPPAAALNPAPTSKDSLHKPTAKPESSETKPKPDLKFDPGLM